jgi:hypothetical protein
MGLLRAPRADLETILTRYAGQVHSTTAREVHHFFLNYRPLPGARRTASRPVASWPARIRPACTSLCGPPAGPCSSAMAATAMLARVVMEAVPTGRCRDYLFGLQSANDAASDSAHWLLPKLYERGNGQREVSEQLGLAGHMLRHAALAAPAAVCSPSADGPPS